MFDFTVFVINNAGAILAGFGTLVLVLGLIALALLYRAGITKR